jgi:hypothetical protein
MYVLPYAHTVPTHQSPAITKSAMAKKITTTAGKEGCKTGFEK